MGEPRSVRVAVSLTEREHDALRESANRQRVPVAKAAARMIRGHLATGGEDSLPPPGGAPPTAGATKDLTPPPWLPPRDRAGYREWAQVRAAAVQALLDRYPRDLAALADDWATNAALREQLWALSVWRDHLDVGVHDDPRMELAFAGSLSDFAAYLRDRPRGASRCRV